MGVAWARKGASQSPRLRNLLPPRILLWLPSACYNVITTGGKGIARAAPLVRGGNDKRGAREDPRTREGRGTARVTGQERHSRGRSGENVESVVRVCLLGGFRISVGERTVPKDAWRLRKAASLVKQLALAPGHRLHREQVMALLWPDLGRSAASNNLRRVLHVARGVLDPAEGSSCLASESGSLALCPGGDLWVDVDAFEEAADTARRFQVPTAYRAALELYAGELLPEDRYEEWAEFRREELRRMFLSLLVGMATLHEARGNYGEAVEAFCRALADDPTFEEAHAGLMRVYAHSGRQKDALQQYERLREVLSQHHGAEPEATSRRLREDIAAGRFSQALPTTSPYVEPPEAGEHNLPAPRTSFVGRQRELVEVKRTLAMTQLLTLTGVGGSGKTRLALEVARELVGAYPDGVWLAELGPLSEGELVPQAVARALDAREQPGRPLTDTLAENLRSKSTLLVVDNCEHLADSLAPLLDTLLDSCPNLRVLATSREALGLAGEAVWQVPLLSVPETDRLSTLEGMAQNDAVRLFAERARLRVPDFELTPENASEVAKICRTLEGIPLAIELATARMGTLSLEQISVRLRNPMNLLSSGGRTTGTRQRTLRGTLDWSYKLLSEPERRLFSRISVFVGSFTLEAAEAVASDGGIAEDEVLDLLSKLIDKSLVIAGEAVEGHLRYRMLEPVRQYAQAKLAESGEAEARWRRHATFFLTLAEEAERGVWGPDQSVWLRRLEVEHDNVRAALSRSIERGEAELGVRLAGAVRWFWHGQGYYGEGRKWLEQALSKEGRSSVAARVKALSALGWLAMDEDDLDQVTAAAEEGLELSKGTEIEALFGASFMRMLGSVARMRGDYAQATYHYEESMTLSRKAKDRRGIAYSLLNLAIVSRDQGDHERAMALYEEGIVICREAGYAGMLAEYLISMGYEFLLRGDYERATELNEEAAALLVKQGYKGGLEFALDNLGWAALLSHDYKGAREKFKESLVLCRKVGDKLVAVESLEGLACADGARAYDERAARLFGAARGLRDELGYEQSPRASALREPYLTAARSLRDGAAWEAQFAKGRSMRLEEAFEYALSDDEPTMLPRRKPEQPTAGVRTPYLTHREAEVAALVARGLTNRQIASELRISEHTAATHVGRILKKLGLNSRTRLSAWMIGQGLLR
jgi:predicted ATPase/DNA-binding SARP family transcriptional activator/DNA-binding CsgD family transcriptional regulator